MTETYTGSQPSIALEQERIRVIEQAEQARLAEELRLVNDARLHVLLQSIGEGGWKREDIAWVAPVSESQLIPGRQQWNVTTVDGDALIADREATSGNRIEKSFRLRTLTGQDVTDKRDFAQHVGEADGRTVWATTTEAGDLLRSSIDPETGTVTWVLESGQYNGRGYATSQTIGHLSGQRPPAAGERTRLRQESSDLLYKTLRAELAGRQADVANAYTLLVQAAYPVEPAGWTPEDFSKIDTSKMFSERRIDLTTLDGTVIRAYLKDPNNPSSPRLRMETGDESAPVNVLVRGNYAPVANARADSLALERVTQSIAANLERFEYLGRPKPARDEKAAYLVEKEQLELDRLNKATVMAETINREFNEQQAAQEKEKRRTTQIQLEYALGRQPRSRISGWNPTDFTSIEIAQGGKSAALTMIDGTEMTLTYENGAPVSIAMNTPSGTVDVSNKTEWARVTLADPRKIPGGALGQGSNREHRKDLNPASGMARQ